MYGWNRHIFSKNVYTKTKEGGYRKITCKLAEKKRTATIVWLRGFIGVNVKLHFPPKTPFKEPKESLCEE